MEPVTFKGVNIVWGKDQKEYQDLPAFVNNETEEMESVSCWQLSLLERFKLLFTGKVWSCQFTFGNRLQPTKLSTTLAGADGIYAKGTTLEEYEPPQTTEQRVEHLLDDIKPFDETKEPVQLKTPRLMTVNRSVLPEYISLNDAKVIKTNWHNAKTEQARREVVKGLQRQLSAKGVSLGLGATEKMIKGW